MRITQPELCGGNLIPASPLCLASSPISCMCILLLTTTSARARMWRRSPWRHGLHIIYAVAPCCSSPSRPTAHFSYPCTVHFPLLLGSPCGVLPPAGGMEEEERRGAKGEWWVEKEKWWWLDEGTDYRHTLSSFMWEFTARYSSLFSWWDWCSGSHKSLRVEDQSSVLCLLAVTCYTALYCL